MITNCDTKNLRFNGIVLAAICMIGCSRSGPTRADIITAERSNLKSACVSVELFKNIMKRLPASLDEIQTLYPDLVSFRSKDYWNNALVYKLNDDSFTVVSCGPDSILGTADDILLPNK